MFNQIFHHTKVFFSKSSNIFFKEKKNFKNPHTAKLELFYLYKKKNCLLEKSYRCKICLLTIDI